THVWRIAADRSDATGDTVLAASSVGIWRSTDFGLTSSRTLKGEEATDLLQDPSHAATWYAGVKGMGVLYSTDGGLDWCPLGSGIAAPIRRISLAASAADDRYVYALVIDLAGALTGIYRYDQLEALPPCDPTHSTGTTTAWAEISTNADN